MTNDFTSQWEAHAKEGRKAGYFRVFPEHFLDFFISFSLNGEREFTFQWKDEKTSSEYKFGLKHIDVFQNENGHENSLVLRLKNKELSNLFSIVCFDLAEATRLTKSVSAGVNVFFNRLQRWSDLLSKGHSKQLSFQERLGLMGELYMVALMIEEMNIQPEIAVRGWRGPEGDTNDIGLNGSRIEIKAQLSTQPIGLRISSLTQLADDERALFVALHRFSATNGALTLASLVSQISQQINTDTVVLMDFQRKLILSGYDENDSYTEEAMKIDRSIIYRVTDGFPRLQPTSVPDGISNVAYFIDGKAIDGFIIEMPELEKVING